jgi:glycosyltransferase involved in cell wall biosynthesis
MIHDTIPLRHGGRPAARLLKRLYYAGVTRIASRILTVSKHSRDCIHRDLGVPLDRITVLRYPIDPGFVERVRAARSRLPRRNSILYVGRFAKHKNLTRLLHAFAQTSFYQNGGELMAVGGSVDEVAELRKVSLQLGIRQISIQGVCSQPMLEELYATARLLVMPSLEEGFGLPVWEAMSVGLPVCTSDAGALPEIAGGWATFFSPDSTVGMAAAIDAALQQVSENKVLEGPSPLDFASQIVPLLRDG